MALIGKETRTGVPSTHIPVEVEAIANLEAA
jgi:hypothetical protein